MNIDQKQMNEINKIQLIIFKEFVEVCEQLGLTYYAVHGTLLGALKYQGFFPFDDEIDVAMSRKDYDIFINEARALLSSNLFVQENITEKNYPLTFAKIRNSDTTFIQLVLEGFNVNQGIYMDIFPIDNYPNGSEKLKRIKIKERIYSIRVNSRIKIKRSAMQKIAFAISRVLCPNWHTAMDRLSNLYKNIEKSDVCILYGGKISEIGIPLNWFGKGKYLKFENMNIRVPECYEDYLSEIYGDYQNYSPSAKHMVSDTLVSISAEILDLDKSYREYMR